MPTVSVMTWGLVATIIGQNRLLQADMKVRMASVARGTLGHPWIIFFAEPKIVTR